jgi:hypothetical protein
VGGGVDKLSILVVGWMETDVGGAAGEAVGLGAGQGARLKG